MSLNSFVVTQLQEEIEEPPTTKRPHRAAFLRPLAILSVFVLVAVLTTSLLVTSRDRSTNTSASTLDHSGTTTATTTATTTTTTTTTTKLGFCCSWDGGETCRNSSSSSLNNDPITCQLTQSQCEECSGQWIALFEDNRTPKEEEEEQQQPSSSNIRKPPATPDKDNNDDENLSEGAGGLDNRTENETDWKNDEENNNDDDKGPVDAKNNETDTAGDEEPENDNPEDGETDTADPEEHNGDTDSDRNPANSPEGENEDDPGEDDDSNTTTDTEDPVERDDDDDEDTTTDNNNNNNPENEEEPKEENFCCSWDFKTCRNHPNGWCHASKDRCTEMCGGQWINPSSFDCTAQWRPCQTDQDCCNVLQCVGENSKLCNLVVDDSSSPGGGDDNDSGEGGKGDENNNDVDNGPPDDTEEGEDADIDDESTGADDDAGKDTVDDGEDTDGDDEDAGADNDAGKDTGNEDGNETDNGDDGNDSETDDDDEEGNEDNSQGDDVNDDNSDSEWPLLPSEGPFVPADYSERITLPALVHREETDVPTNCPHLASDLTKWDDADLTPALDGQDVTLPPNTQILLSSLIPVQLGYLTIPESSALIIDDVTDTTISIDCSGIIVYGNLVAGSETCRLDKSKVEITLHGQRPADAVESPPPTQVKGIDVRGGVLSLHGKYYGRTWTRLSRTVRAGDSVLLLQHAVDWEPGQQVVVVTTALKDSREWHQNEIVTIRHVYPSVPEGVGTAVVVDPPLRHVHLGIDNYQAEVGLLSRNIKIQGAAADSEPTDPDPLTCRWNRRRFGDRGRPCAGKELTGFGAHVIIHGGGVSMVEGVELFRVGQTNVLGRYPMHYHLLGDCPECYFRDSSVHRSYYRCVAIHGTHSTDVSENVAYDVSGYCYYFEDGVERNNTLSFNVAAHIHLIGPEPPNGPGQATAIYTQSQTLTLPADVTASGFYITNIDNNIIGNVASGGWSGFAFPNLPFPIGDHKNVNMRPSAARGMTIDGNTAHSTGWWWGHAGAFYFGGALYYDARGVLTYNPGRSHNREHHRDTCAKNLCEAGNCNGWCLEKDELSVRITNSKTYLSAGTGLNSWSGLMEIIGFESHDNGLSLESLANGFWIDELLSVCRTGQAIALPDDASITSIRADGFFWYDTGQEHIITDATFRNCGVRSSKYAQYNSNPERGCSISDASAGCNSRSTVFGFLAHSDQFNPEIMQGTARISFENCGRRFRLHDYRGDNIASTVSGRLQNWLDADGSASGLGEPTLIVSGLDDCGLWWEVDDDVVEDEQGPLKFIKRNDGPERGLGHVSLEWDSTLHRQVGKSLCGNGRGQPCPPVGYIRHLGPCFSDDLGLPVTANADIVGPVGGHGWLLELFQGAPKELSFKLIEVDPDTPLMFSVPYPVGTSFEIVANAKWCEEDEENSCTESFQSVSSVKEVRESDGNTYHVSTDGVLTFRIVQFPKVFVGRPEWFLPTLEDAGRGGNWFAIDRFERDGVLLPSYAYGPWLSVTATCAGSGAYCTGSPSASNTLVDSVCPDDYTQVSYDKCCAAIDETDCVYANGQVV